MPGIYGCFGCTKEEESRLQEEFSKPWEKCEHTLFKGGIIGGHSFSKKSTLQFSKEIILAVDGEISIYHMAEELCHRNGSGFSDISSAILNGDHRLKGNLVIANINSASCQVVTEWTGTFPLYYAQANKKFIFCSRQKPIAKTLGLVPDYFGILEFFRNNYMYAGRTFFNGLRRLLPGQTLHFNQLSGVLQVGESSQLWIQEEDAISLKNLCDIFKEKLTNSLSKCLKKGSTVALMMSGGWDSRLLLGGLLNLQTLSKVKTYVHGDIRSREINLVKKICHSENIECFVGNYGAESFDVGQLQQGFNRTELVIFPHWHIAGKRLANQGLDYVTAGVYGEVLGGHYGSAMLLSGWGKAVAVGSQIFKNATNSIDLKNHLGLKKINKPWQLKNTLWKNIENPIRVINEDLEFSMQRLTDRGIKNSENLIEAFIAEHRATQLINSQILSCRASLDIALPFCDQELLDFSWKVPMAQKTQNALTRDLLRLIAPDLLDYPTAATLLPAYFPILFQEASRALRVLLEEAQYKLTHATAGHINAPSWSWLNNEFLRTGSALTNILDDLRCDFWDMEALAQGIKTPEKFEPGKYTMNNLLNRFLKIYSVDLMLR